MRVVLIHALRQSIAPAEAAFREHWPQAERVNLLDDSLSEDLARHGRLDEVMERRFVELGRYARSIGADAILFTCSAFGPCIEAVRADLAPLPVRRPNEAAIAEAVATGGRIALLASFGPTLQTMPNEFPLGLDLVPIFVAGALEALDRGDTATHDRLVAEAAAATDADAVMLSQYSLARAADGVRRRTGKRVITTPEAAVIELRLALASAAEV